MKAATSGNDPQAAQARATQDFAQSWAESNGTNADAVLNTIKENGL